MYGESQDSLAQFLLIYFFILYVMFDNASRV